MAAGNSSRDGGKEDARRNRTGQHIDSILPGSIAEELGIESGDWLIHIDGERIIDRIDYTFLSSQSEFLLGIRNQRDNEVIEIEIEKGDDEFLGLIFDDGLMGPLRTCANKCLFCFVDQMKPGLRESLYVKDDDWRMSFLMGNFVTLTNVSERELERIIRRHISPLYVSVQATEPSLRCRLLGNSRAGELMHQLRRLADAGVQFHAQFVLCPGINDGEALERSFSDLFSLGRAVLTAAVVPVGLTRFRKGLENVAAYNQKTATEIVERVERWQKRAMDEQGRHFAFASDEFYILSGREVPESKVYEGFPQIENGVGMIRKFSDEYQLALSEIPEGTARGKKYTLVTGTSAKNLIETKARRVVERSGADIEVIAIRNDFFGQSVSVAGLVVGGDIQKQLAGKELGDAVLIPDTMLKDGEDIFLDGSSVEELADALQTPVIPLANDGASFVYGLADYLQTDDDNCVFVE